MYACVCEYVLCVCVGGGVLFKRELHYVPSSANVILRETRRTPLELFGNMSASSHISQDLF